MSSGHLPLPSCPPLNVVPRLMAAPLAGGEMLASTLIESSPGLEEQSMEHGSLLLFRNASPGLDERSIENGSLLLYPGGPSTILMQL